MDVIQEFEHLINLDGAGLLISTDGAGMEERIREWLNTPCGTIADKPGWGHNLATLKHEPIGPNLNVMAEMLIIEKIRFDIRDLSLTGVSIEFIEIDRCYINIDFTMGKFTGELFLSDKSAAYKMPPVFKESVTLGGPQFQVTVSGGNVIW